MSKTSDFHTIHKPRPMFFPCRPNACKLINKAKRVLPMTHALVASSLATTRCVSGSHPSVITMETKDDKDKLESIFEQKRLLRSEIRQKLKNMDPVKRSEEDDAIQNIVIGTSWFKSSKNVCAYVSCPALREVDTSKILSEIISMSAIEGNMQVKKKLYVPRVLDRNSNMRMLKISSVSDLIANSMNIMEPTLLDSDGNQREDVMEGDDPIDLFIVPGLAFDRAGRRLGRSGGYYDMFLRKYQELVKERRRKQPLLVALSYSLQIMEEGSIAVSCNDIPVDALVTPSGVLVTSSAAMEKLGQRILS